MEKFDRIISDIVTYVMTSSAYALVLAMLGAFVFSETRYERAAFIMGGFLGLILASVSALSMIKDRQVDREEEEERNDSLEPRRLLSEEEEEENS